MANHSGGVHRSGVGGQEQRAVRRTRVVVVELVGATREAHFLQWYSDKKVWFVITDKAATTLPLFPLFMALHRFLVPTPFGEEEFPAKLNLWLEVVGGVMCESTSRLMNRIGKIAGGMAF